MVVVQWAERDGATPLPLHFDAELRKHSLKRHLSSRLDRKQDTGRPLHPTSERRQNEPFNGCKGPSYGLDVGDRTIPPSPTRHHAEHLLSSQWSRGRDCIGELSARLLQSPKFGAVWVAE